MCTQEERSPPNQPHDKGNKNVNNPQKARENISYVSDVALLKRYLRPSTGSQSNGAECGFGVGSSGSGVQYLGQEM
jgi:hypothetical protein